MTSFSLRCKKEIYYYIWVEDLYELNIKIGSNKNNSNKPMETPNQNAGIPAQSSPLGHHTLEVESFKFLRASHSIKEGARFELLGKASVAYWEVAFGGINVLKRR